MKSERESIGLRNQTPLSRQRHVLALVDEPEVRRAQTQTLQPEEITKDGNMRKQHLTELDQQQ